jgi:hypothetical protein
MNYDFLEMEIPAGLAIKTFAIFYLAFPVISMCRPAGADYTAKQVDAFFSATASSLP